MHPPLRAAPAALQSPPWPPASTMSRQRVARWRTGPALPLLLALQLLLAGGAAQAQQVWRCGNSYQGQPCPGGEALPDTRAPTRAERAQHEAAVARDAKAAAALERDRLQAERRAQRVGHPAPPVEDVPPPNGGELFTARVPHKPKATTKGKKPVTAASAARG